jgi:hypothetical protein
MSNLCPSLPEFNTISEAREIMAGMLETIELYGRTLGKVQPALRCNPELSDIVNRVLEP